MDMHTAQHLVANCLSGVLARDRSIILVTHHISLCLHAASNIVELSHGRVVRQGSIQDFADLGVLQKVIEADDETFPPENSSTAQTLGNEADVLPKDVEPKARSRTSNGKLIEAETRAEGRVSMRTYLTYFRAAGLFSWILTVFLMLLIRGINISNQVCSSIVGPTV